MSNFTVIEKEVPVGKCEKCGAVGGVWIEMDGLEGEVCPECLIEIEDADE